MRSQRSNVPFTHGGTQGVVAVALVVVYSYLNGVRAYAESAVRDASE
jgi:hypothetical protein